MMCIDGCGQPDNCECGSSTGGSFTEPPGTEDPLAVYDNPVPEPERHEERCPAWHRGPCICKKDSEHQRIEGRTHLEVTDLYNDLCNGVRHWMQTKIESSKWDEYDESLSRWFDINEHQLD